MNIKKKYKQPHLEKYFKNKLVIFNSVLFCERKKK